jgi:hypothetical protein
VGRLLAAEAVPATCAAAAVAILPGGLEQPYLHLRVLADLPVQRLCRHLSRDHSSHYHAAHLPHTVPLSIWQFLTYTPAICCHLVVVSVAAAAAAAPAQVGAVAAPAAAGTQGLWVAGSCTG